MTSGFAGTRDKKALTFGKSALQVASMVIGGLLLTLGSDLPTKAGGGPDPLAPVRLGDTWRFITTSGVYAFPQAFDEALNFSEGLAAVKVGEKFGYIDTTGQIVIPARFDYAGYFSEGLAAVQAGQLWGFIDRRGEYRITPRFSHVQSFSNDRALINADRKWGYIDRTGEIVIPAQFSEAHPFYGDVALVAVAAKKWLINRTGKMIRHLDGYADVEPLSDGVLGVKVNGKWGTMDTSGNIRVQPEFDTAPWFSEGLAKIRRGMYYSFIDASGRGVTPPIYSRGLGCEGDVFTEGLVPVWVERSLSRGRDEYTCGLLDRTGALVVTTSLPSLTIISCFSDGLAKFETSYFDTSATKFGYIDRTGRVVIPARFDSASSFSLPQNRFQRRPLCHW